MGSVGGFSPYLSTVQRSCIIAQNMSSRIKSQHFLHVFSLFALMRETISSKQKNNCLHSSIFPLTMMNCTSLFAKAIFTKKSKCFSVININIFAKKEIEQIEESVAIESHFQKCVHGHERFSISKHRPLTLKKYLLYMPVHWTVDVHLNQLTKSIFLQYYLQLQLCFRNTAFFK